MRESFMECRDVCSAAPSKTREVAEVRRMLVGGVWASRPTIIPSAAREIAAIAKGESIPSEPSP
jgi:hypothetical protein